MGNTCDKQAVNPHDSDCPAIRGHNKFWIKLMHCVTGQLRQWKQAGLTVWSSDTCYGNILWGFGERRVRFPHCAQIFHCIASGKKKVLSAWESVSHVDLSLMCRRKFLIAVTNHTWLYPYFHKMRISCQLISSIQVEKQSYIPSWGLPKLGRGVGENFKIQTRREFLFPFLLSLLTT
jgi:hypothetical protein